MGIPPFSAKAAFCVSKQLYHIVTDPDLTSESKPASLHLIFNLSRKFEFIVKRMHCDYTGFDNKSFELLSYNFVLLTMGEQAVHLSKARLAGRTLSNLERKPRICGKEVNMSQNLTGMTQRRRIKH